MSIDAILKRYFIVIVLGMLALAAYFQAGGATQLVGTSLLPGEESLSIVTPLSSAQPAGARTVRKTAQPILNRNPFDSQTGPLNAQEVELPAADETEGEPDVKDPLRAPQCSEVRVNIVTESTDPLWSLAALQGPGDSEPAIRRVGDTVGGAKVAYIGYNSFEGSPSVWMVEGKKVCQALLFAEQPQAEAPAKRGAQPTPRATTSKRGPPSIPADMKNKIHKVSATEFNVDRSVVDQILENQATLMRSARIVPEQKDGQVVGVRLFGIRPDTLLGTLGMQNGDRLETVNGYPMASPEKALEAYSRLRTSEKLTVTVSRRGKPVNIEYNIK